MNISRKELESIDAIKETEDIIIKHTFRKLVPQGLAIALSKLNAFCNFCRWT